MTDKEIEQAKFDLSQDVIFNQKAREMRINREMGSWYHLTTPKLVNDAVLDADPKTAAWLWAKDKFILINEDEINQAITSLEASNADGYDLECTCWDRHTLTYKKLFINRVGDYYKVVAVIDVD